MDYHWEPVWHDEGLPSEGDFIQLRIANPKDLQDRRTVECMIIKVETHPTVLIHTIPEFPEFERWEAVRWRRRIFPDLLKEKVREEELA